MRVSLDDMARATQRQVGDIVLYHGARDNDGIIECAITGISRKEGRLIYFNSVGRWGYVDQYSDV